MQHSHTRAHTLMCSSNTSTVCQVHPIRSKYALLICLHHKPVVDQMRIHKCALTMVGACVYHGKMDRAAMQQVQSHTSLTSI